MVKKVPSTIGIKKSFDHSEIIPPAMRCHETLRNKFVFSELDFGMTEVKPEIW